MRQPPGHGFAAAYAHHQAGRLAQAVTLYRRLRSASPDDFRVLHVGGAALFQLDQPAEAVEWLKLAARQRPASGATRMCLGLALARLGRPESAEQQLREAVRLDPGSAEASCNLGSFLLLGGQTGEAIATLRRSVELQPRSAQAWSSLGSALLATGQAVEALAAQDRALAAAPRHAKARSARAQALYACRRLPEALADFEAVVAAHPAEHEARSFRLLLLHYLDGMPRAQLAAEHAAYGRAVSPVRPRVLPRRTGAVQRLRVAFLSPDFRTHSVAFFLEPLLAHLDPGKFELVLYHDHFTVDATSGRLRARAALWRNFVGRNDAQVEAQVLADAPDILMDLTGHTGFNRMALLARRLAPVQISYLGYPDTTGLAAMDFRLTDALTDPPGEADALHTEKLVRFAPTAWCYRPPDEAPAVTPPPGAQPAGAGITFGSFNNLNKLTPGTLALWARVLAAVPGSRLLIKGYVPEPGRLLAEARQAGLPAERLVLAPTTAGLAGHLACYHRVDIALDPFPYHGTTTTCEALWMGRPVVTLAGDRHASRVGVSLLTAAGQSDCIASSPDEYVRIAAGLAADPEALAARSAGLRDALRASPLLDHAGQGRRFGEALRRCWEDSAYATA
jgi:predicted O-linked N-acetylglucosamine transferase (SPINDLY family)